MSMDILVIFLFHVDLMPFKSEKISSATANSDMTQLGHAIYLHKYVERRAYPDNEALNHSAFHGPWSDVSQPLNLAYR